MGEFPYPQAHTDVCARETAHMDLVRRIYSKLESEGKCQNGHKVGTGLLMTPMMSQYSPLSIRLVVPAGTEFGTILTYFHYHE